MNKRNASLILAGVLFGAVAAGLYATHQHKRKSDPLCNEVRTTLVPAPQGPFQLLNIENISPLCMQALGEKMSIKASDTLSIQLFFNEKNGFYIINSRGVSSPKLRLKPSRSMLGDTTNIVIGLPNEEINKMLSRRKIQLVPENPTTLKQLDLSIAQV